MTKRILSILLSLALLIGSLSGLTLIVHADSGDGATYAKIDFTNANGVVLTNVTELAAVSNGSVTPTEITDGVYGAPFSANGNGISFKMEDIGITAAEIESGEKQLAVSVEYYNNASHGDNRLAFLFGDGKTAQLGMYTNWTATWDSIPLNRKQPMTRNSSSLFTYIIGSGVTYIGDNQIRYADNTVDKGVEETAFDTKAHALALVNGEQIQILNQSAGFGYIRSITIFDASEYTPMTDPADYAYYNFESGNPYYPMYAGASYGMSKSSQTTEPDWVFFQMADAFSNPASKTIAVRFFMKDGYTLSNFRYSYNRIVTETNNQWGDTTAAVTGSEFVYEFTDAAMAHELNHTTDFRVSAEAAAALARVEIHVKGVGTCQHPVTIFKNRVNPTPETEGYEGDIYCKWCDTYLGKGNALPQLITYAKVDFTDPNGATLTNVKDLATVNNGSITPTKIADGVYGIPFSANDSGISFKMDYIGITADEIESGEKQLAVSVEYYNNANNGGNRLAFLFGNGKTVQLGMYTNWSETWDAVPLNRTAPMAQHTSALYTYTIGLGETYIGDNQLRYADGSVETGLAETAFDTKAQALALVNGEMIQILNQSNGFGYIRSITIYDASELPAMPEGPEGEHDWYMFDVQTNPYYPQYGIDLSQGMSLIDVVEEPGVSYVEDTHYFYLSVKNALVGESAGKPVAVRFTFKEGADVSTIGWSYQKARRADVEKDPDIFCNLITEVEGRVVTVVLNDAALNNELQAGRGSIRVRNTDDNVCYQLESVEVFVLEDKTELNALRATDTTGMTLASVALWKDALAATDAVAENLQATADEIAAAVEILKEAQALLVVCEHKGETVLKNVVDSTCFEGGYSGDTYCVDCDSLTIEGEYTKKHDTEIRGEKDPTCYAEGYTGDVYCMVCDKVLEAGESIEKEDHVWDDGTVTTEPTVEEEGVRTFACTNKGCTETYTESVPRLEVISKLGDVNGSNKVDSTDARLVLQYAVGKIDGDALNITVANVNGDNKVDSTDARLILQLAVGKIQAFPTVQ